MSSPLSILIVEDNLADFELIANELVRYGFPAHCQRVTTEAEFMVHLEPRPDVILACDSLAAFGSLRALEISRESGLEIPVIVLTASPREEQVVAYLKKGAADYLPKTSILRVGPAVERALEESALRRQNVASEQALRRKNQELEEQYRRAQSASRMKSIFLANMSHELRTPLTAVIGFAELLVDGKAGALTADQQDFTQDILANGKHLLTLINDVLDLARVESGTMPFHPERICLPDLIRETIAGPKLFAAARNITLTTDVQMSAIEIFLDPQKLRQVLLNYVSNALKFTPPGGRVTVHAHFAEDSTFRLEVEDTGIGIAPQDIERLFQDFHQLDGGLSREVQGTGLGLALTKRLVEAQGGKVGVVSQPGKGSRFYADLPCSADWMESARLESARLESARLESAKMRADDPARARPATAYLETEAQAVRTT